MVACGAGGGGGSRVQGGGGRGVAPRFGFTKILTITLPISSLQPAPLLTRRRTDNCNEETGWGKRPHSSAKPKLEAAPLAPSFLTPHPHKAPLFCSFRFDVAVAAWHLLSTLPLSLSQTPLAAARTERSLSRFRVAKKRSLHVYQVCRSTFYSHLGLL